MSTSLRYDTGGHGTRSLSASVQFFSLQRYYQFIVDCYTLHQDFDKSTKPQMVVMVNRSDSSAIRQYQS